MAWPWDALAPWSTSWVARGDVRVLDSGSNRVEFRMPGLQDARNFREAGEGLFTCGQPDEAQEWHDFDPDC